MMLEKDFIDMLSCPACGAQRIVPADERSVTCPSCRRIFEVRGQVPCLFKDPAAAGRAEDRNVRERPRWHSDGQIQAGEGGPYRHHLNKRLRYLESVLRRFQKQVSVLDAGCGDGVNLNLLTAFPHFSVVGIDSSWLRLSRAQALFGKKARLVMGSLLETALRDDSFDVVLCNHVLEHIPDDEGVLRNICRMLRPDGMLILGVPNEGALLWRIQYRLIQPSLMKTTDHVHFYTARKLVPLLEAAGFRVRDVKPMGWGVPHSGLDKRLRAHKWIDDLFDAGYWLMRSQSTSLYLMAQKGVAS